VAKTKKSIILLILTCLLPALLIAGKPTAIPLNSDGITASGETLDFYPVKKDRRTAACMDFGGDNGFGQITIGVRAGACTLFDPNSIGFGIGGDVRIRLAKRWSLEAYSDFFKTAIMHLGFHSDLRYGFNALYYWIDRPMLPYKVTPFLLGGISYEDNSIRSYQIYTARYTNWSPWLDIGIGQHYFFTPRWDITLEFFYVLPLASHPYSFLYTPVNKDIQELNVKTEPGFSKGGIFGIISLNYTFGNI
jgi:hypothetical protein